MKAQTVGLTIALTVSGANARAQNFAGDEALSKVLLDDQSWQLVAESVGQDGGLVGWDGAVYYVNAPTHELRKIAADDARTSLWKQAPRVVALKAAADGRLIVATRPPLPQILIVDPKTLKRSVLARGVAASDLAVTKGGRVYLTDPHHGTVRLIDPARGARIVATQLSAPTGITLSPDEGTLIVAESRGAHAWAYRIDPDGTLSAGAPWIDLRTPVNSRDSGDSQNSGAGGATTDALGRFYIATTVGVQMFDWTGRLGGVIATPPGPPPTHVAFAGPERTQLFVRAGDRVYRRLTKASGIGAEPRNPSGK